MIRRGKCTLHQERELQTGLSQGRFITVEGGEGAGKSSNLQFIASFLRDAGLDPLLTREPGGTVLGEEIRDLLLAHREGGIGAWSELLLIFAARAEHLEEVVRPALEGGRWVVCDRFTDASYAYQGGGRELGTEPVARLEDLVQGTLRPDLTILLDVPVDLGLERAGRRANPDRFEIEGQDFMERVRTAYLARAAAEPGRIRIVDASRPLEEVQRSLAALLRGYLETATARG